MTTLLRVYQEALRFMGERRLTSITEARDARYHLDDAYTDALQYCLEQGLWNFAMKAAVLDPSDSIDPEFGFTFAYTKPSDWVRSFLMAANEFFYPLLTGSELFDEAGYWYANFDPLYVKYVSNSAVYGGNLTLWPQTFATYVSSRLAVMTAPSIADASDQKMDMLFGIEKRARVDARSKDAMNEGPLFPPQGSWASSRRGNARSRAVANFGRVG